MIQSFQGNEKLKNSIILLLINQSKNQRQKNNLSPKKIWFDLQDRSDRIRLKPERRRRRSRPARRTGGQGPAWPGPAQGWPAGSGLPASLVGRALPSTVAPPRLGSRWAARPLSVRWKLGSVRQPERVRRPVSFRRKFCLDFDRKTGRTVVADRTLLGVLVEAKICSPAIRIRIRRFGFGWNERKLNGDERTQGTKWKGKEKNKRK